MPVPDSVTTRVVRGTYVDGAGTPEQGIVSFRLDQPLIATVEAWGIVPGTTQVTLDSSGAFTTTLMVSDDVDLFPSGFRYIVQERFSDGYVRSYRIDVPSGADPLDLPTTSQYDAGDVGLATVNSVNGLTGIVQLTAATMGAIPATQRGAANGVATLDSGGKIPVGQLPAGTAGVTSVDGRSGVVTLTDLYASLGHVHTFPVSSVNGKTGVVVLAPADVGAVSASLLGANSGVATLDSGGKLLGAQVPAVALNSVYDVANQSAMLALTATLGDLARRTDVSKTFILTATDPSVLANWKELITPPDAVSSVNGQTGAVTLSAAGVGAVPTSAAGVANGVATLDGSGTVPTAQVPNLDAAKITSGLVNFLRLPTGATSTTVAIGNHTHAYVPTTDKGVALGVATLDSGGKVPLAQIPSNLGGVTTVNGHSGDVTLAASDVGALAVGTRGAANGVASLDASSLVPVAQIPNLDASKITSGTLAVAQVPTGTTSGTVATGDHTHTGFVMTSQMGVASGVATLDSNTYVPIAQIPTGTISGTVATGDHAHAGVYLDAALLGAPAGVATLDNNTLLSASQVPSLDAAKITSGVLGIDRIPLGTDDVSVAIGNHTHGYIPTSDKGATGGVAPLDTDSRVPLLNLPTYLMRGVVLNNGDVVPSDLPVNTVIYQYSPDGTSAALEGLWDGTQIVPVTLP